jgi:uncharacterized membrane protein YphA (DoxX/SURF4 family)
MNISFHFLQEEAIFSSIIDEEGRPVVLLRGDHVKKMDTTLWIVQVLLALAFLVAGFMMVGQPIERLKKRMHWVTHYPVKFVRLVGIVAILGALGLVLPGLTHILPWLTPVAAGGLVFMMIGALVVHLHLKEYTALVPPIILLFLFLFIVYGRFVLVPLA